MVESTRTRLEEIVKTHEPTLKRAVDLWKSYRDCNQKHGKSLDTSLTLYYNIHLKRKGESDSDMGSDARTSQQSHNDGGSGVEFTLNSFEHMAIKIRTKQVVGSDKDQLVNSVKDMIFIRSTTDGMRQDMREAMGIFSTQLWQEKMRRSPQDKNAFETLIIAMYYWNRARSVKATTNAEFKSLIGLIRTTIDDLLLNIVSVIKSIKLLLSKDRRGSLAQGKTQPTAAVLSAAPVKPATKETASSPLLTRQDSKMIGTDDVECKERSVSAMKGPSAEMKTTGTDAIEERKPEIRETGTSPIPNEPVTTDCPNLDP